MTDKAVAATLVGAVIGGLAGYFFFSERGRALRRQLEGFQKRLAQTAVTPAPGVPPRDARNVVVTQQPGNLPGRSVGPPNTASGVGTPGAPQPEPASPISSARDTIKVSLSGQVDRALLYGDDDRGPITRRHQDRASIHQRLCTANKNLRQAILLSVRRQLFRPATPNARSDQNEGCVFRRDGTGHRRRDRHRHDLAGICLR